METIFTILVQWLTNCWDTTFWGWLITFCYGLAIITSLYYLKDISRTTHQEKHLLWSYIVGFLILMGINKQLDFQILIKIVVKMSAEAYGWFEYRRLVQAYFAKGIVLIVCVAGISLLYRTRHVLKQSLVELTGCAILLGFALIRTSSINHIRKARILEDDKISHIHAIELLGIVVILIALWNYLRFRRKESST